MVTKFTPEIERHIEAAVVSITEALESEDDLRDVLREFTGEIHLVMYDDARIRAELRTVDNVVRFQRSHGSKDEMYEAYPDHKPGSARVWMYEEMKNAPYGEYVIGGTGELGWNAVITPDILQNFPARDGEKFFGPLPAANENM